MQGKHPAMKGFDGQFTTSAGITRFYLRVHAASNPGDRSARYHSYDVWFLDPTSKLSYLGGWYNTGDPRPATLGGARFVRRTGSEPSQRPIMLIPDEESARQGINCEQWYTAPGEPAFSIDFGWTICNATVFYRPDENTTPYSFEDMPIRAGELGLTRRVELAWYANRTSLRGTFTTDQFGEQINSCVPGSKVTKYGTEFSRVCIQQTIQPSLPTLSFDTVTSAGRNAIQRTFPDGNGATRFPN
jgi:hypothetical protein